MMIVRCDLLGDTENDYTALMRRQRNLMLSDSDWTQTADDPTGKAAEWAAYRQQLRDFPSSWTPAPTAEFPDPPA